MLCNMREALKLVDGYRNYYLINTTNNVFDPYAKKMMGFLPVWTQPGV